MRTWLQTILGSLAANRNSIPPRLKISLTLQLCTYPEWNCHFGVEDNVISEACVVPDQGLCVLGSQLQQVLLWPGAVLENLNRQATAISMEFTLPAHDVALIKVRDISSKCYVLKLGWS